MQNPKHIHY